MWQSSSLYHVGEKSIIWRAGKCRKSEHQNVRKINWIDEKQYLNGVNKIFFICWWNGRGVRAALWAALWAALGNSNLAWTHSWCWAVGRVWADGDDNMMWPTCNRNLRGPTRTREGKKLGRSRSFCHHSMPLIIDQAQVQISSQSPARNCDLNSS